MKIRYTKIIRFPFEVVLDQYFDFEHIKYVHPRTLGEYRLLECDGNRIVYEQIWPRGLLGQARSVVEQRFTPPGEIQFEFLAGRHRGVRVHSLLTEHDEGTHIDETYVLGLPDWRWLRAVVRPFVIRTIERIWKEDLDVDVCRGGWPGIPGKARPEMLEAT